ncbi:MAG TPA: OmpA family protein, partial [Steroidobacteraceae bacterium]|nr:OmpA family protein [Steroidobacteraceae bacterium]
MNTTLSIPRRSLKSLTLAAAVSCVLAACATTPQSPEGAAEVRSKLTRLQSDPNLTDRAPLAVQEAETAVRIAEEPVGKDVALGAHRVYFADRKVEIAIAQASTRYAEDQRKTLTEERERARLAARTREADRARADADAARAGAADAARIASADGAARTREADRARADADAARAGAADAARVASADAARAAAAAGAAALEAAELQRQIDELQAKETDRGLVLTLGDVLFTSGQADLTAGVASNLGRLATFLHQNPGRNVEIEGHTDSVGSAEYNQALSQRRADSVRSFLIQQGIGPERIRTSGKGEHQPVADN